VTGIKKKSDERVIGIFAAKFFERYGSALGGDAA
jgi:hypothetical protein